MNNLFEVKVIYLTTEKGKDKKVKETFLIQANSFGEAETKMIAENPSPSGIMTITDIKKSKLEEIYPLAEIGSEPYFKVDVEIEEQSDITGATKKVKQSWIVQADDLDKAHKRANEIVKSFSIISPNIIGIKKSPIVEWIPMSSEELQIQNMKPMVSLCSCDETCSGHEVDINKRNLECLEELSKVEQKTPFN